MDRLAGAPTRSTLAPVFETLLPVPSTLPCGFVGLAYSGWAGFATRGATGCETVPFAALPPFFSVCASVVAERAPMAPTTARRRMAEPKQQLLVKRHLLFGMTSNCTRAIASATPTVYEQDPIVHSE